MYHQKFTIEGQDFGESLRDFEYRHGKPFAPWSVAFFCPHEQCGRIWATVQVDDGKYHVLAHHCERHPREYGWMTELPGSIWSIYDKEYNDALPDPVLRRELDLALAFYERGREAGGTPTLEKP